VNGSTGLINLNKHGSRVNNLTLSLISLKKSGFEKVGEWSSEDKLQVNSYLGFPRPFEIYSKKENFRRTIRITVLLV
jgi:hypothetical protein